MKKWNQTILLWNKTVKDAVECLNETGLQITLIVDDQNRLIGTVTDSDIRRAILKEISFSSKLTEVMNPVPKVGLVTQSEDELHEYILNLGLRHLPIIDEERKVVELKILDEFVERERLTNSVLIMAGGLGSRLRDLTKDCPKPMLEIDGMPLLEINIRKLKALGFKKFYLSVNYLSEMIEDYFKNGSHLGIEIEYLKESTQLGTAGAITLMPENILEPFLVINGDLLTELNFSDLMYFHNISSHDVTVCVRKHEFTIPYGVFELEGTSVLKIQEKPSFFKFINAGIYIMNPSILKLIKKNESLGMNDLLNRAVSSGMDVECYTIKEYWKDIGTPEDLEQARQEFKSLKL